MPWRERFMSPLAASMRLCSASGISPRTPTFGSHDIFGVSEGFFLGLQMDYDLMQRRRQIDRDLRAIRPRAA
jgi:hypothetical protein